MFDTLEASVIMPRGIGDELAPEETEVMKVIRASGLAKSATSMLTKMEGELDEVTRVVEEATLVVASRGIRIEIIQTVDVHLGSPI